MKRVLSIVLVLVMAVGVLSACGGQQPAPPDATPGTAPSATPSASSTTDEAKPDTISLLLPPVSATYQDQLEKWAADFNAMYPNLTLNFQTASWEDYKDKMDVQVNAGSPPDIAFVEGDNVAKYVDTGLLLDIKDLISAEQLADFDENALAFYRNGDGLYGLPTYISIQALGGNKAMLDEAGIDWKTIQKNGWTYDEFRNAIKAGTKEGRYGFIFACAGVTAADYLNILTKNAGMPSPFNKELKYAYTGKNFKDLLVCIREVINDGSTPKEMGSVDAGKRWNMFLTGQTMIFGKGLANFESLALANNAKIKANDGSAVENSKEAEYVVLPVPTFFGEKQAAQGAAGGYSMFRGKEEPTAEHLANMVKALYFMAAGDVGGYTANELYLSGLSKSARDAMAKINNEVPRSPENSAAMQSLTAQAAEPRPDIPAELGAKHSRLMDEVIVPKFQALLANELTPDQMYEEVKKSAIETFGEDGVVKD